MDTACGVRFDLRMPRPSLPCLAAACALVCACSTGPIIEYSGDSFESSATGTESSAGSGEEDDGSSASGDGDGDATSSTAPTTSGDGDGDDPTTTGDGDGDDPSASGDGDGDPPMPECGNGVKEGPGEECDGQDFGGFDCAIFNFDFGDLACTDNCTIDTSGCFNDPCGDGILDEGEQCDLQNFGDETCISQGEGPGALMCTEDCIIDASGCGIPGEGEGCVTDDGCPDDNLYCADLECWDGSPGDDCYSGDQCLSGVCDGAFFPFPGDCT